MSRITPIDPATATGDAATHLAATKKMLGATPNLFTTAARSPAALAAMNSLFATLGKAALGGKTGELIAIAIAQANGCAYCLSAHSAIGASFGLSPEALASARVARSTDPRTEAILALSAAINQTRGKVDDATLASARLAGLTDAEIVEIVAHVALNVFTNYLNNVAETAIDFPVVTLAAAA